MNPPTVRIDPYQLVTDTILSHLERGVVPCRCPWNRSTGRPLNFHSGREYQGVNVLLLGLLKFSSPWWMTLRQANERGGRVRKGEHGATVMKWGRQEATTPKEESTAEKKVRFFLKTYRVFNASQIEGIELPPADQGPLLDPSQRIVRAQEIIERMPQRPIIREGQTTQACYRPSTDTIDIPAFVHFASPEEFHLTLFHEAIHATGAPSRLARKGVTESEGFGGKVYSQEELVAEMGAAFLGMEVDIVRDSHEQSAAYLKGWLDVLGVAEHRRWIVLAANQAGRAADFILGRNTAVVADAPAVDEPEPHAVEPSVS